jgi:hypothetical protein
MTRYALYVILAMSMANFFAWAEPEDDSYTRIARISYMEGPVSFQNTSDVDWTAAAVNLPLQLGDRIYTGPQGRAEIEFDEGSVLRLAESTDIQFLSLKEEIIQIRILTGLSSLTVASSIEFEMDTPAAAFIVLSNGSYRFDTKDNGDTDAIVRKGELEAVSHRFVHRIASGERMFVTADENSSYNISSYNGRDAWDEWNDRRNADSIARSSRRYLPDNVYAGVSDLDRHGRWVTVESYGAAWVPYSVGVSWSPYSVGRWCYRPTWGWTWVSYESWGWLPYHYGRWYNSAHYGWCWLPGPSFSFNFWSPGLVTFYSGPAWVSWCPLGPGDYYSINNYYYNRRLHAHYIDRLRGLHHRSPGDSFNRHARGAFQTEEIEHFRNGGSRAIATNRGYRQIDRPWDQGNLVRERLAVQPTSRSFSADPDRRVVRSKIVEPKRAVVHAKPTAIAVNRDGYVQVTNSKVTSRVAPGLRSSNNSGTGNGGRLSGSDQDRVNSRSTGGSSIQKRSNEATENNNRAEPRTYRSNERGNSVGNTQNNDAAIRDSQNGGTNRQSTSRQRIERTVPEKTAVPRDSSGGRTGRDSGQSGITGSPRSISSSGRTAMPQETRPGARESVRTNSSSNAPRSSGSGSRTGSYSAPSSGRSSSGEASSSTSSEKSSSGSQSSSGSRKAAQRGD